MKVGYIQFDVKREREENFAVIEKELSGMDCQLVVLPELCLTGYLFEGKKDLLAVAEPVPGPSVEKMQALSRRYHRAILFGMAERQGDCLYNTAVLVREGEYLGKYRKMHCSDFEKRFFLPGEEPGLFEVDGVKVGVQICFDLWFPEVSRTLLHRGAELFCVLANFGGETSDAIARVRAIENLTPMVLCNRVGFEALPGMEASFLGRSHVAGPDGSRLLEAADGRPQSGCCEVPVGLPRKNVICGDFDAEIRRHYKKP